MGLRPLGFSSASAAPSAAHVFNVEDYGAAGDGKLISDLAVTNGSAVVTSESAEFVEGDVGKHIMVNGGIGANNIALMTTIASVQSATQATLAAPASVTVAGLNAIYGTDDTDAIQAASDAARDYAVANSYYAEVRFLDRYYIVAGAAQQLSGAPATYNTQIRIPYAPDNTERKLVIAYIGAGDASHFQFWASTRPNLAGTCLVSLGNGPSEISETYGPESVLGGPTGTGGFTGNFVNTKAVIKDLSIWSTAYTNRTALDLSYIGGCHLDGYSSQIFAQAVNGNGSILDDMVTDGVFASRQGTGIRLPSTLNNADVWCPNIAVEGYNRGLYAAEHVRIGNLKTIYNDVALIVAGSNGVAAVNGHGLEIHGWTAEVYNGGILALGAGPLPVHIVVNTEVSANAYDIRDDSNGLRGIIRWATIDARAPLVVGAAQVHVINEAQARGAVTTPAVPATTVALVNPFWRDCAVSITGGTVSGISVDGQALGVTSGTVFVPSGKSIAVTYSSAPTWKWTAL